MNGPLLLDSNLLLLFIVGLTDINYIGIHKNLKHTYTIQDYDILTNHLEN